MASAGSSSAELHTDDLTQRDIESRAEHFRFLRDERDLSKEPTSLAEAEARSEYDRVFKEFAIADLSQYRMGRMGLRWRTQSEVVDGKGQTRCANQTCARETNLSSYEVDFAYREHGADMSALVKIRLCPKCTKRMFKARRQSGTSSGGDNSGSGSDRESSSRSRRRRTRHGHREHRSHSSQETEESDGKRRKRKRKDRRDRSRS